VSEKLHPTPSATVGPYLAIGLTWEDGPFVVAPDTPGAIWLRGIVYDGLDEPIVDAMVETWQADPDGRFDHPDDPRGASAYPGFRGFGRSQTVTDGQFEICTLKPGPLPDGEGGWEAPHVDVSVFARGLLDRVVTRIYFPDEADANAADPVLRSLPEDRRQTLVATKTDDGYRFDVHLQGDRETVFFDV
jgi:protocatechuate 3,4-dioxygenase alpha subunit